MFARKQTDTTELDKAINAATVQLDLLDGDSEEYAKIMTQLVKLHELKNLTVRKPVSSDTLAIVMGNLLGIIVIVGYERGAMITSKALQFVTKAAK